MNEKTSEKSPEQGKGSNIEEARRKVEEARGKLAKIREGQAATRQALAKEIVDMAEGNKELSRKVQGQREEFGKGYRETEERKGEEMQSFRAEVQRGEEELATISQEMGRIQAELQRDSLLNVELPSKQDIEEIREALRQGAESLRSLQGEYQELVRRHGAFEQAQESFARDPLKSAMETVFWAHEEMTKNRLSKEEREALIQEHEQSLGRPLSQEERLLLIEEREASTKRSLSTEERNAIAQEVQQETQRRSQAEQQEFEVRRQREVKEAKEKELASYRERLDSVDGKYRIFEQSTNDAVRVIEEELEDGMFLEGVNDQWSMIVKNHDLLAGGRFGRLLSLTNKKTAQENFTGALNSFSDEYSKKHGEALKISQETNRFIQGQTDHYGQEQNLYLIALAERNYAGQYAKSYLESANPELSRGFQKLFDDKNKLEKEMQDFNVAISKKIRAYTDKLNEVFHKNELDEMTNFFRRLPRI